MCRKIHGTPFGAFAHAAAHTFRWFHGEASITRYRSSPEIYRCFCRVCGSSVPVVEGAEVCIPAGSIDGDPGVRPSVHIFVESKAPWYQITDTLQQFARFPPDDYS
ncbi:MAG: GFA family protein [Pseudomonadota bacterium]|nr:GFA family protein [Pseudomonadota bacterium]